jgi:hypothetical protein
MGDNVPGVLGEKYFGFVGRGFLRRGRKTREGFERNFFACTFYFFLVERYLSVWSEDSFNFCYFLMRKDNKEMMGNQGVLNFKGLCWIFMAVGVHVAGVFPLSAMGMPLFGTGGA